MSYIEFSRDGYYKAQGDEMSEEGTKITIRMNSEEIQKMEDFMSDHDIGNRSDFIRDAICGYIESKTQVSGAGLEGGIFVRLNEVQMETLKGMVCDGTCYSEEEFIRTCVLKEIVPEEILRDSVLRSVKAAQLASRMK